MTLLVLPGQVGRAHLAAAHRRRRRRPALLSPWWRSSTAELAGNLGVRPDPHPCSGHVAWIGMSVGAEWRGIGVGDALLEVAADWAGGHGVTKLALSVFPHNQRAVGFYERNGFVREGLRHAHLARAGRYYDEVLMARFLTPLA